MDDHNGREAAQHVEWKQLVPDANGLSGRQYRHDWIVVLAARNIPYFLEHEKQEWRLLVPEERIPDAIQEVNLYEDENHSWPPLPPPHHSLDANSYATLSVLVLLAAFHNFIRSDPMMVNGIYPDWFSLGMTQSARILDGEWWRLITALTLHANLQHLLGNLVIGGGLVILLCRELGTGLSWTLLLGAGILGNLANAFVQPPTHNSFGASTAVFGVVGILAGLSLRRYRQQAKQRWVVPVAAALSLLVLLGSEGKNTDLGAHLFGLLSGLLLGLLVEPVVARYSYPGRRLNLLLAACSAVCVMTAWWFALNA